MELKQALLIGIFYLLGGILLIFLSFITLPIVEKIFKVDIDPVFTWVSLLIWTLIFMTIAYLLL